MYVQHVTPGGVCTYAVLFLSADLSLLLRKLNGVDYLKVQTKHSALAMVMWRSMKRPENIAASLHATQQLANFTTGHGRFLTGVGTDEDISHLSGILRVVTDHWLPHLVPGGYSQQGFTMMVNFCLARLEGLPRPQVTYPVAQITRSHESWCRELSPLLTRYCMLVLFFKMSSHWDTC